VDIAHQRFKSFGRRVGWIWRRLSDAQTVEWIYEGRLSLIVSTVVTWLIAWFRNLTVSETVTLAVAIFTVAMPGFRLWQSRRRTAARAEAVAAFRTRAPNGNAGREDVAPAPPGIQPEHIRRDLGRLLDEGEQFIQRRLSISASSLLDRMVPEGFWDYYVVEWRDRASGYLKDAGLDGGKFAQCSPHDAKTLTLEQLRNHVARLREAL
jgi:hypothetical protein